MGDLHSLRVVQDGHTSVIRSIKPKEDKVFYRARSADQKKELQLILAQPLKELGPPPPEKASAGRMNSDGVPAFYGAFERETCVAELRPSLGSTVVSAGFKLTKPVRVLDFQLLEESYHDQPLSFFQPDFHQKNTYRRLLGGLHAKIRQAVVPGSEREYLVTQVLVDYLVNVLNPKIDGILFSSVQNNGGTNVVLFSHALDIQLYEGATSIMGKGTCLKLAQDSVCIHRISAIKYDYDEETPIRKKSKHGKDPFIDFSMIEF